MNARNLHSVDTGSRLYEVVDRTPNVLPQDYLPHATCVAIAGDPILRAIGYRPGSKRPSGWIEENPSVFRYPTRNDGVILQVREGRKLWVIERYNDGDLLDPSGRRLVGLNIYSLCAVLIDSPICARTCQAAMRLAEYCHPNAQQPIVGYWAQVNPQEHDALVERYIRDLARLGRALPDNELWVKRYLERTGQRPCSQ